MSPNIIPFHEPKTHCGSCTLQELCVPFGLDPAAMRRLDELISYRAPVKKRETLYRPGETFNGLFAIRLGSFKTLLLTEDGREQIIGYRIAGEILGLDGIGSDRYTCEVVALEDSQVCFLPFKELDQLALEVPPLRRNLFRLMSRDLCRDQDMMLLLGSRSAEERLALFLLNLAERYQTRGYSARELVLRMTREEIASFLGLKLETVSRLFSSLQEEGLIQVQGRAIKLLDPWGLKQVVERS